MADVLFIKTSSLGDVVHHMPAITEARAHRPKDRFVWVVEEPFAPLVRLHGAVDEVIPVATRRWRRSLIVPSTWSEMLRFRRVLRGRRFDEIVDTQGLVKSALLARSARGRRHGYDTRSVKEPFAAHFYDARHTVEWNAHAIVRNRTLTGLALGYEPQGAPNYGLDRARIAERAAAPYAVLLHATAWPEKLWPLEHWRSLAAALGQTIDVVLPWGTESERANAEHIASAAARAQVPPLQRLDGMARLIAGASLVVGVDTGLLHLAAALGVPLVAIFVGSEPALTGPLGSGPMAVVGGRGAAPTLAQVSEAILTIDPR
jgi:heptosyltransferase-1